MQGVQIQAPRGEVQKRPAEHRTYDRPLRRANSLRTARKSKLPGARSPGGPPRTHTRTEPLGVRFPHRAHKSKLPGGPSLIWIRRGATQGQAP